MYITEDGSVFKNFCEPADSDIKDCDEGVLSIIKVVAADAVAPLYAVAVTSMVCSPWLRLAVPTACAIISEIFQFILAPSYDLPRGDLPSMDT